MKSLLKKQFCLWVESDREPPGARMEQLQAEFYALLEQHPAPLQLEAVWNACEAEAMERAFCAGFVWAARLYRETMG